ncbi:glycoside hydrolase family 5 protein [Cohnella sp. REN36]|uniref:glycoside hydrolase family 5 protein n=1 Tax=Cohnella sp. REN36 TaxID=2887347 RepID=UPI00351CEADA
MNGRRLEVEGWVKAQGQRLVNGRGEDLILRGPGLGSWLLPEGYMWKLPEGGDRPRRIERMIAELIGQEEATAFWRTYHDRYTSEEDIRRIAEEGFNSVRVPFNARMLLEGERNAQGYSEYALGLLDRIIDWCRQWKLYVILDMHGAPGGQTGANIDDSERDQPELYIDPAYRQAAIDMWRMLAERYRDEWIVAGYDLLNEPLPDYHGQYHGEAEPLYRDMIRAIREVDDRHLIILEGVHWSTDWSIFTEPLDGNVLYQFHKYWNNRRASRDTSTSGKRGTCRSSWAKAGRTTSTGTRARSACSKIMGSAGTFGRGKRWTPSIRRARSRCRRAGTSSGDIWTADRSRRRRRPAASFGPISMVCLWPPARTVRRW